MTFPWLLDALMLLATLGVVIAILIVIVVVHERRRSTAPVAVVGATCRRCGSVNPGPWRVCRECGTSNPRPE